MVSLTFCEFTVGFAFGSFVYLYLLLLIKGVPEIFRMLRNLNRPESWK